MINLDEVRIELYDDNLNFMGLSNPKSLDYLNYAEIVHDVPFKDSETTFQAFIALSSKVSIEKRVVHDVFMMLGEVGGLHDFLTIMFGMIFGNLSGNLLSATLVKSLYQEFTQTKG